MLGDDQRLPNPFLEPTTKHQNSSFRLLKRGAQSDFTGSTISPGQRSNQGGKFRSRFREQHLPCSKKWTEVEAYPKPEAAKFIYGQRTLQNGGHKVCQGPVGQRRFHVQARPERHLYLSIPIHPAHQKYLRFWWKGNLYQYTALLFGLATATRVFTKVMKPILASLCSRGLRMVGYLDDLLIIDKWKEAAEQAFQL